MSSHRIRAHLDTPIIGELSPLDGPTSWAFWQKSVRDNLPLTDITPEECPDFDLPFETWQRGDYWGWCVSDAIYTPGHYSATEIRRRPATGPMAAFTAAREHHHGLGQLKARNVTIGTTHAAHVDYYAEVTDLDLLRELIGIITHLGARHRNGFGHVTRWEVSDALPGMWQQRPMPSTSGRMMRTRAPYWHPTERTQCEVLPT